MKQGKSYGLAPISPFIQKLCESRQLYELITYKKYTRIPPHPPRWLALASHRICYQRQELRSQVLERRLDYENKW